MWQSFHLFIFEFQKNGYIELYNLHVLELGVLFNTQEMKTSRKAETIE